MRQIVLLLVLFAVVDGAHAQRELDPTFGDGGHVTLGFDATAGDADDYALAACPHPSGSLVVTGLASRGRRVVTAWLTPDGQLDTTFSGDGKESFPLPAPYHFFSRLGICHPSGRIYLAYEVVDDTDEGNLRVIAVDPDTGLPVLEFGVAGIAHVDLDAVVNGLGKFEEPGQLAAGADGSLLVAGHYDLPDGSHHGHALRIGPTGALLGSQLSHREGRAMRRYAAISPADDETLWAVGVEQGSGAMSVLRLRSDTLDYIDTLQGSIGDGLVPRAARHVDGGRLLIAAARGGIPVLASVWRSGWSIATAPDTGKSITRASITPQTGSRHMVVWQTSLINDWSLHFARAVVASTGRVSFDGSFGSSGVDRFSLDEPDCQRVPFLSRMTIWNDHPTVAARVHSTCEGDSEGNQDYLVVRLKRNFLFADGLE